MDFETCRQGSGHHSSIYLHTYTQSGLSAAGKGGTGGSAPGAAELDVPLIDGVWQAAACRQGSEHDVTNE